MLKGKLFPIVGRISMDYLAVDVSHEEIHAGDVATLIGKGDQNQMITAEEIAEWSHTIPYEIVTRIQPQIPRIVQSA